MTVTTETRTRPRHVDEEKCRAFQYAAELVGRRWTGAIMLAIALGSERFAEIRRLVDGVSDRMLSVRLKELEADGLVTRTIVPTYPAYSRYMLTPRGTELMAALQPLIRWGMAAQK